ncbi:MAG: hypothetical protein COB36_10935 [Alphaproteobacteria bacterium]|nr:MAG: hypothetical protein COB36_10935 [Alphaproteobacteria bacterium]
MYYYQFHIGDYVRSTTHLTPMEDLVYRRLLDRCYDTEKPLEADLDKLCRFIRTQDYKKETQQILEEFFSLTQKGWIQKRVQKELGSYLSKADTSRANGKLGGRPKKTQQVIPGNPDGTCEKANQEPLTINQEPLKDSSPSAPVFNFKKSLLDLGVDQQAVDTWLAVRKKKRAVNSELALKGVLSEVQKSGISVNEAITASAAESWSGFKAEWYSNLKGSSNAKRKSNSPVIDHEDTSWLTGSAEGQADSSAGEPDIQRASNIVHRLEAGH